ncbi:response regulator transcription factor [Actinacidiphila oryziradicis]|uniref:Response regulator transcription factor n=1 Tax=Actinacidiphila oryziradicis TaxID=2571141 RepID=A0A4U0SFP6_9ACTN|nr:response regulator transcription factor [Actinacidiphila oryziradicis]TKA08414.1 response regulator transcription factor [Actinacidiphila oryziradicis]
MHATDSAQSENPARILIVDDEPAVREALARSLEFEGYLVDTATDGMDALEQLEHDHPDLILLDVMMPVLDGLAAARRIRAKGDTVPILMLTARDAIGDRIVGLDNGADDYLPKPFAGDELLARVRALLRRSALPAAVSTPRKGRHAAPTSTSRMEFEDVAMDLSTREVTRAGKRLDLTKTEYALLKLFMSHPRQVLSRAAILRDVWGFDFEPTSNTLDVYVMYLRRKTESGSLPRIIHTERGTGYVLRASKDYEVR